MWASIAVALADCPNVPPDTSVEVQVHTMGVDPSGHPFSDRESVVRSPVSIDLDQDGVSDLAVPIPVANVCPELWTYALWRTEAACAEPVGQVVGLPRSVSDLGKSTLEVVTTTVEVVPTGPADAPPVGRGAFPPERRETIRTYRFDGNQFTLLDIAVKRGTCHHCALRICQTALPD